MIFDDLKNSEIAVLVLSTRNQEYEKFRHAVDVAWLKQLSNEGVNCYFYSGNYSVEKINGNHIELTVSDYLCHTAAKLIAAIDVLLRTHPNIKLIYRTNLSSYIEPGNFIKYIKRHQLGSASYRGVVGNSTILREKMYGKWWIYNVIRLLKIGRKIKFASGSGFFIGVDHAKKLLTNSSDLTLIDDVMVADTIKVVPQECDAPPRFDILEHDRHMISVDRYRNMVYDDLLFHYRFKTADRLNDARLLLNFSDINFRNNTCVRS